MPESNAVTYTLNSFHTEIQISIYRVWTVTEITQIIYYMQQCVGKSVPRLLAPSLDSREDPATLNDPRKKSPQEPLILPTAVNNVYRKCIHSL